MTFGNPIVGGDFLVRPAIKSPNFVTGVSGWSINRDGTAEFQNLLARATIILGNPAGAHILLSNATGKIQVFDAGGNLVADIDANGIEALNPNGSFVNIFGASPAAVVNLQPANVGGFTFAPAALYALAQSVLGREIAFLQMDSPSVDGNPASTIILASADDLANPGYIELDPDAGSGAGIVKVFGALHIGADDTNLYRASANVLKTDDTFNAATDVQVNGSSLPRGILGKLKGAANSGTAALAAETKDTSAGMGDLAFTAVSGRSYRIIAQNHVNISVTAATEIEVRVRDGGAGSPTTASTLLFSTPDSLSVAGGSGQVTNHAEAYLDCPADIAAGVHTIAQFIAMTAGGGGGNALLAGSAAGPKFLVVEDMG